VPKERGILRILRKAPWLGAILALNLFKVERAYYLERTWGLVLIQGYKSSLIKGNLRERGWEYWLGLPILNFSN